ncbi:hypothetical protein MRX96_004100 [Rhipicephalus microplus]
MVIRRVFDLALWLSAFACAVDDKDGRRLVWSAHVACSRPSHSGREGRTLFESRPSSHAEIRRYAEREARMTFSRSSPAKRRCPRNSTMPVVGRKSFRLHRGGGQHGCSAAHTYSLIRHEIKI